MKSEATHSCLISVLLPKRLGLKLKISKFCQNKNLQNLQFFLRCGVFCLLVNCSPLACSVGTHLNTTCPNSIRTDKKWGYRRNFC